MTPRFATDHGDDRRVRPVRITFDPLPEKSDTLCDNDAVHMNPVQTHATSPSPRSHCPMITREERVLRGGQGI